MMRYKVKKPINLTYRQRLKEIAEIIEGVDNRILACDGPSGDWRDEALDSEWLKIYRLAKAGAKK